MLVQMCLSSSTNPVMLPKWEVTNGKSLEERDLAIEGT